MVSVVITDYIQFVVLSFGMLFVCLYAVSPSWAGCRWWRPSKTCMATPALIPSTSPVLEPSYVVWMIVYGFVACAVWPTAVMRVLSAKSEQVVRRLYNWSAIGFTTRFIIPQFLGICALTWLWQQGDASGYFPDGTLTADADETIKAMPRFLATLLPTGVIGLVAAGMLAAFMSTNDSYLLCWAASIVEDVINPLFRGRLHTKTRLRLSRLFIFLIGVYLLIWSVWYPLGDDMLDYLAVSGAIYFTGAFSLLVLGLYWPKASTAGAYAGLCSGLLAILGLGPVRRAVHLTEEDLGIAITDIHIGLTTMVLAIVAMVLGSLLFPNRRQSEAH